MRWTLPGRAVVLVCLTLSSVGVGAAVQQVTTAQAASGVVAEKDWKKVGAEAAAFFASKTGIKLTLKRDYRPPGNGEPGKDLAATEGVDINGGVGGYLQATTCRVYLDRAAATRGVIAHETFHCLQLQLLGSDHEFKTSSNWLAEGGAAYAGCLFVKGDPGDVSVQAEQTAYKDWITDPSLELFSRSYDAIGFWALLSQAGVNPLKASLAGIQASDDTQAYQAAVGGHEKDVLNLWASTAYRDPQRKPAADWDVKGPCTPSRARTAAATASKVIHKVGLPFDGHMSDEVASFAAKALEIKPAKNARVMHVVTSSGTVRVNGHSTDKKDVKDSYFCVKVGGCVCPKGMAFAEGELLPLGPSDPLPAVAITGGTKGAKVMISEVPFTCSPSTVHVVIKGVKKGYPQFSFQIRGNASSITVAGHKQPFGAVTQECPPKCDLAFTGTFVGAVASDVSAKPAFTAYSEAYGYPYAISSMSGCKLPPGPQSVGFIEENAYPGNINCSVRSKQNITITITMVYRPFVAMVASGLSWGPDPRIGMYADDTSPLGDVTEYDSTCWGSAGDAAPLCAWHMYPGTQIDTLANSDASAAFDSYGGPCAGQGTPGGVQRCHFTVGTSDTVIPVVFRSACPYSDCGTLVPVQPNPLPPQFGS